MTQEIKSVLFAASFRYPIYAPAVARALIQLGIDVIVYDFDRFYSKGKIGLIERRFVKGPAIKRINKRLLDIVRARRPSVILIWNGSPIMPATLDRLRETSLVVSYHNDDPFGDKNNNTRFKSFVRSLPHYHRHFVYRNKNIHDYENLGLPRPCLFPSYFVPWLHYPTTSDDRAEVNKVVFVGHAEPDVRIDFIKRLLESNIPLRIYGDPNSWRKHLSRKWLCRLPNIELAVGDRYRYVLGGAKICLSFYSNQNNDNYTRRVFEIPACGGFLLTQRSSVIGELYRENEEAVFFESYDELVDKIMYYLKNHDQRQKISLMGYKRCVKSGYDVISRTRQALTHLNKWASQTKCI